MLALEHAFPLKEQTIVCHHFLIVMYVSFKMYLCPTLYEFLYQIVSGKMD